MATTTTNKLARIDREIEFNQVMISAMGNQGGSTHEYEKDIQTLVAIRKDVQRASKSRKRNCAAG